MNNENMMTVKEAAKRLAVHEQTIRAGIISEKLPIGNAVMGKNRYVFIIPRKRFETWESGEDLKPIIMLGNQQEIPV